MFLYVTLMKNIFQVKKVKPHVLLGLSGVGGVFDEEVIDTLFVFVQFCFCTCVLLYITLNSSSSFFFFFVTLNFHLFIFFNAHGSRINKYGVL